MAEIFIKPGFEVAIIKRLRCLWCGGVIYEKVVGKRRKKSNYDTSDHIYQSDYHEACWAEAIEVEI